MSQERSAGPKTSEEFTPASGAVDAFIQAIRDRFAIQRELGRGAMGVVYLARDLKHDRYVALKVLRPDLSAAVMAERFTREIHITSRLQHPNVLPLFDSGRAADCLYYVTPHVTGESLRDRLNREQQLPVEDAITIARAVAEALAYAHSQNVVHRDIKPENILLSDGQPIVADFGIARAVSGATDQLTATGIAIGTPAYMSPEQADGEEVDGRADIYGLGCVLYEMLAGVPPFQGGSARMVIARHARDPVPSLRTVRAAVTPQLEAVIMKALQKTPSDRYHTAKEFSAALAKAQRATTPSRPRWMFAAAAAVAAIPLLWWAASRKEADATTLRAIALLPCETASRVSDSMELGDRYTEELIQKLVRVGGLEPKSWASVRRYKGSSLTLRQIAKELNAQTLARCTVSERSNEVRLSVELIRARDEGVIWSQEFRERGGIAAINAAQTTAAREIGEKLGVGLTPEAVSAVGRPLTRDSIALNLYRVGRFYLEQRRDRLSFAKAAENFAAAIARDSSFAQAYVGLVEANDFVAERDSRPTSEIYATNIALLRRATSLDPQIAEAHTWLALYLLDYNYDWKSAETEHRKALALNPGSSDAHSWYGLYLLESEQLSRAVAEFKRAKMLDPTSGLARAQLIRALYLSARFDLALSEIREAVELNPTWPTVYENWAIILLARGQRDSAVAMLDHVSENMVWTVCTYARAGRPEKAKAMLDSLLYVRRTRPVDPVHIASLHIALDHRRDALDWLERAYAERSSNLIFYLGVSEAFDPVRNDPRFQALRRQVGLKT